MLRSSDTYLEFQELLDFLLIICEVLDRFLRYCTEAHEKLEHLSALKFSLLDFVNILIKLYLMFKHFIEFHLAFYFVIRIICLGFALS